MIFCFLPWLCLWLIFVLRSCGSFLCLGQQTEVKVKLHFEELNFHDASEEEWREKLLQHFHQDQGISTDACASLQIEFAEGAVVAALVASCVINKWMHPGTA